ncbi:MAG TPA: hypothetical protein VFP87_12040, partial [Chitinophagaceae bacterium]|nr:hypothetical protein [Chitinophagaceae bacterium]
HEKKKEFEAALGDPVTYSDKTKFLDTEKNYKLVCEEITGLNDQYEKVFERIIRLESDPGLIR